MVRPSQQPDPDPAERGFWERSWFLVPFVLLTALPLAWPDVPPLIDLPGHMGRYRIQLDLPHSPDLARYYSFQWSLIGNLGVDLLVVPLAKLVGLELAVKLIVMAIPPLTVAGFLWIAREVHGRVTPTALFAAPFAYAYPFLFGFVNFALSMAFAFLAFGLWLRLARLERFRLRAALFVPISALIWVTHTFGWGALGLLAFSAEAVRQHDRGHGYVQACLRSAIHCLALTPPVVPMLLWRSGHVQGFTEDPFNIPAKLLSLLIVLRDRWLMWDTISLGVILMLILRAIRSPRLELSRNLAASALVVALVFLLLPRIVFGSAYADMRLAPYIFALAVVGIRPRSWDDMRFAGKVAMVGLCFAGLRIAGNTASFWLYDRDWDRNLAALDHVPSGARVVVLIGRSCGEAWLNHRRDHLSGMALVRGASFTNDQWAMAGAQLLRVHYPEASPFVADPSQIVIARECRTEPHKTIDQALAAIPRNAFDYVWLIDPPAYDPALTDGLEPVWGSGESRLFRIGARDDRPVP